MKREVKYIPLPDKKELYTDTNHISTLYRDKDMPQFYKDFSLLKEKEMEHCLYVSPTFNIHRIIDWRIPFTENQIALYYENDTLIAWEPIIELFHRLIFMTKYFVEGSKYTFGYIDGKVGHMDIFEKQDIEKTTCYHFCQEIKTK